MGIFVRCCRTVVCLRFVTFFGIIDITGTLYFVELAQVTIQDQYCAQVSQEVPG